MAFGSAFVYAATAILCILTGIATWIWLWLSRDKNLSQVPFEVEWRRAVVHAIWLFIYLLPVFAYFAITFSFYLQSLVERDGTWHQIIVRDNSNPEYSDLLILLALIIFLDSGIGSLLFAKTRLRHFAVHNQLPYWIVAGMPFAFILACTIIIFANNSRIEDDLFHSILTFFSLLTLLWFGSTLILIYQVFVNLCQVWRNYRQSQT